MADIGKAQNIKLENRSLLCVSGVTGMREFSENEVVFECGEELLVVDGESLCVTKLALESGESAVTGRIDSLAYSEMRPKRTFLSRLFG